MKKYSYYERKINYYETDKMGIVHHSNYARFLEEARIDMMQFYDIPFEAVEEAGYMIPVLELHSNFKEAIRYGETVKIVVKMDKVTPVKFFISYVIYDETMTSVKHIAESSHCFINSKFMPVSLKKERADMFQKFLDMQE